MKVAGKKRRVTETEVKQQLVDGIHLMERVLVLCWNLFSCFLIVTSEGSKPTFFFFCNRWVSNKTFLLINSTRCLLFSFITHRVFQTEWNSPPCFCFGQQPCCILCLCHSGTNKKYPTFCFSQLVTYCCLVLSVCDATERLSRQESVFLLLAFTSWQELNKAKDVRQMPSWLSW